MLKKQFNVLTGLQFSSFSRFFFFFLKTGLTDAFSEKTLFVMSLLLMSAISDFVALTEIFFIFGGILSRPVAFSGSNFLTILFISSAVARNTSKFSLFVSTAYYITYYLDDFSSYMVF